MKKSVVVLAIATSAVIAGGCASTDTTSRQTTQSSSTYGNYAYGVVDRIEVINKGDSNNVAGTVIGGIVGGLIGHQIGGGTGQTAATVAGAVGGAVAGNQIEQRRRTSSETFRVTVRLDDGSSRVISQDDITDLRTGDRVRIDNGRVARY